MKANQKFSTADEAVSPVIGVILMVAITVVLAAVVFVLVQDLGSGTDAKPQVAFTKDEQSTWMGGILTVASIDGGPLTLTDIVIGGDATCSFSSTAASTLSAGDQITCEDSGTITVSHTPTSALLYSGSFSGTAPRV